MVDIGPSVASLVTPTGDKTIGYQYRNSHSGDKTIDYQYRNSHCGDKTVDCH